MAVVRCTPSTSASSASVRGRLLHSSMTSIARSTVCGIVLTSCRLALYRVTRCAPDCSASAEILPAVDIHYRAGHEPEMVGHQAHHHPGHIGGCARTLHGNGGNGRGFRLRSRKRVVKWCRLDETGS